MDITMKAGPASRPQMGGGQVDVPRGSQKSAAVGQVAKQIVSDARAAGADLPKNAQGIAASQIARGADPATIFAARVADADTGSTETTPVAPQTEPEAPQGSDATEGAELPPSGPDTTEGASEPSDDETSPEVGADATPQNLVTYAEALLSEAATKPPELDILT